MVSVIIVNYKVEKEVIDCILSIYESKPKTKIEIIVVDNDSDHSLKNKLKDFSQVKYIKAPGNIGFGAGNNLGAKHSSGEYLFFLNPDTIVQKEAIDTLLNFIKKNSSSGMVAPLLLDLSGKAYFPQGSDRYNFLSMIIVNSFINKLFPNNPISRKFFHKKWDRKKSEEFDVVPGTAFMISKKIFKKVSMFDEKLFLYFEEHDLARKLTKSGYKNFIVPQAKIKHIWGASTKKKANINKIFLDSRNYFLKKNYGNNFAFLMNLFLKLGKNELLLGAILLLSLFLNLYKIDSLMTFIGDQGWFYLSARDMLITSQIPLVGITSSHPWLHQGAFWTYIIAAIFWLFNFNPLAPGYFTSVMGTLTVFFVYIVASELFSKRIGLIAAFLYATSPLIILSSRMPYHTSLIPLFTLFFIYFMYKWIKGDRYAFPFSLLFLAILYNFEIQTALLWFGFVAILIFGTWKKADWCKKIVNIKIAIRSLFFLVIPMITMLIYDISHGFPQTLKFGLWIGYHIAKIFGFPSIHGDQNLPAPAPFIPHSLMNLTRLIFSPNQLLAAILFLGTFLIITYLTFNQIMNKKANPAYLIIYLFLLTCMAGYIITGTASGAYFPLFFPFVMLMLAIGFNYILSFKKIYALGLLTIFLIATLNSFYLLKENYFTGKGYGATFTDKLLTSQKIVTDTENLKYNIVGKGPGSQFPSFIMNYEYLTWWLGHGPSNINVERKVYIFESQEGIRLESNIKK